MRVQVSRPRTFVPPEAAPIAARFRAAASQVRALRSQLSTIRSSLDENWEGNSKIRFFSEFSGLPNDLESQASWLDDRARQIESMTVTIWETVWVEMAP